MASELQDLLMSDVYALLDPEERMRKAPGRSSASQAQHKDNKDQVVGPRPETPESPETILHGRRHRPKMVAGHCMIFARTRGVGVWEQELRAHVLVKRTTNIDFTECLSMCRSPW